MRIVFRFAVLVCLLTFFASAEISPAHGLPQGKLPPGPENGRSEPAAAKASLMAPELLNLGTLSPGRALGATLLIEDQHAWRLLPPPGWKPASSAELKGNSPADIRIEIRMSKGGLLDEPQPDDTHPVELVIETEQGIISFEKAFSAGAHTERLQVEIDAVLYAVTVNFELSPRSLEPVLAVDPPAMDFGLLEQGKIDTKRFMIRNAGRAMLHWKARLQGTKTTFGGSELKKGRYVSLFSNESIDQENYIVPAPLQGGLQLSGNWSEHQGIPYSRGGEDSMQFSFSGTGIELYAWKDYGGGSLSIHLDDAFITDVDLTADEPERVAIPVADGLPEGPHQLRIIKHTGYATIEGFKIFGDLQTGTPGWIRVFPDNGTTTSETDYVNVRINSAGLSPGYYVENILIESDGGAAVIGASIRVAAATGSRTFPVFKYMKGSDIIYTAHPGVERTGALKGYRRTGVAFRLYREDTPGTKKLYRWVNRARGVHYYSTGLNGNGRGANGMEFDGYVGNIATSRLPGTRELYHWYNQSTGQKFYTTDARGEGMSRKGFRFQGIVGFVL